MTPWPTIAAEQLAAWRAVAFWSRVRAKGPSAHWYYDGAETWCATVRVKLRGVEMTASRAAFILLHGRELAGRVRIERTCRERRCISPFHHAPATEGSPRPWRQTKRTGRPAFTSSQIATIERERMRGKSWAAIARRRRMKATTLTARIARARRARRAATEAA